MPFEQGLAVQDGGEQDVHDRNDQAEHGNAGNRVVFHQQCPDHITGTGDKCQEKQHRHSAKALRVQAAAQNKADDQQRRTADPKVQAGDGERIHLLGHGFVPRPGQCKNHRSDQHIGNARRAAAAVVAKSCHQHTAEPQRTANSFARRHAVGFAVQKVCQDNPHKALGAVQNAAHDPGQQGNGGIIKGILCCRLPQAQPAAGKQIFALWHGQRPAPQRRTPGIHQQRAEHKADTGKAHDGSGIGGVNGKQPVPHFDKRERRPPQHIAHHRHAHRSRRVAKKGIQTRGRGRFCHNFLGKWELIRNEQCRISHLSVPNAFPFCFIF